MRARIAGASSDMTPDAITLVQTRGPMKETRPRDHQEGAAPHCAARTVVTCSSSRARGRQVVRDSTREPQRDTLNIDIANSSVGNGRAAGRHRAETRGEQPDMIVLRHSSYGRVT